MIPEDVKDSIDRYVKDGVPLGDFLTAVMANDLMEAFGRADFNNTAFMRDIVAYVYNCTPFLCKLSIKVILLAMSLKRYTTGIEMRRLNEHRKSG
jgi:hypothetical protein